MLRSAGAARTLAASRLRLSRALGRGSFSLPSINGSSLRLVMEGPSKPVISGDVSRVGTARHFTNLLSSAFHHDSSARRIPTRDFSRLLAEQLIATARPAGSLSASKISDDQSRGCPRTLTGINPPSAQATDFKGGRGRNDWHSTCKLTVV